MTTPSSVVGRQTRMTGFFAKSNRPRSKMNRRKVVIEEECEHMMMDQIDVKLPPKVTPYPSQKLMMFRILQSLKTCQNAMIESPTGSGKTLGLLSSTCAWLQTYQQKRLKSKLDCPAHGNEREGSKEKESVQEDEAKKDEKTEVSETNGTANEETGWKEIGLDEDELATAEVVDMDFSYTAEGMASIYATMDDDFVAPSPGPSKRKSMAKMATDAKKQKLEENKKEREDRECTCLPRVRIYYGTRTHKQIGQVVKEFARLPYAGVIKHTILGSRDQSCINPEVKKSGDVTGACKELIGPDGPGCAHKQNIRVSYLDKGPDMRRFVEKNGETVWDLEDLVDALSNTKPTICPYFASTRILTGDADLIFCPFSYLLDPIIRDSSDVHMNKAVVILDEAHNVEDTCRSAASFDFTEAEVNSTVEELQMKLAFVYKARERINGEARSSKQMKQVLQMPDNVHDVLNDVEQNLQTLSAFTKDMHGWFRELASSTLSTSTPSNRQTRVLAFQELYNSLKDNRWHWLYFKKKNKESNAPVSNEDKKWHQVHEAVMKAYNFMVTVDKPAPNGPPLDEIMQRVLSPYRLSGNTIVCMEKFTYFMTYYSGETKQVQNKVMYKAFVCIEKEFQTFSYGKRGGGGKYSESQSYGSTASQSPWREVDSQETESENGWLDSRSNPIAMKLLKPNHKITVSLWCMIPALSFMDAFSSCRSIILASGTLTPVETFESELAIPFKYKMDGKQVIPSSQIMASVIPVGPNKTRLTATYANLNRDNSLIAEFSEIIKSVCETVPKGVLCFFSSYSMLEKVWNYMEENVMLKRLQLIKDTLKEPRRSSDLPEIMQKYEKAVKNPKIEVGPGANGALLFAVLRGKVSEGIDFTDDMARCVITFGIPYPSFASEQVQAKRKFNDECSSRKSTMPTIDTLSGDKWYSTQAYRALNQALGRCLRHRNDWGALVLVDERFQVSGCRVHPSARISSWVKEQLVVFSEYDEFKTELGDFVTRMEERDAKMKLENGVVPPEEVKGVERKPFSKIKPTIFIG